MMNLISAARIYVPLLLETSQHLHLPEKASRHIQVLRLQPKDQVTLFNGRGGEWKAVIKAMHRQTVEVDILEHIAIERTPLINVSLLVAIPANERMDFLVEKATELGVYALYPLLFERSVVKLNQERSAKKHAHWQAITTAACEQCGTNRIPFIHQPMGLMHLLQQLARQPTFLPLERRLLGFRNASPWPKENPADAICVLSGPEGGLTKDEEDLLITNARFKPYSLGSRVLRADTAPLAALSKLTI